MTGVSVIVPCHNEESAIRDVVLRVRRALGDRPHEVLVVDDGSSDGTADRAAGAGARVLRLTPNRGKGVALQEGVREARFPVLAFLDGDGQDDPADLPALLERLSDDVDLVLGSRFLGTLHAGSIHPLNRIANQAFSGLISVLFGHRVTDSQAGFRVLRRQAYLDLAVQAREYDVETDMLLRGLKRGWRVVEVPVARYARHGDHTDFRRVRHGVLILWTILRARVTT